RLEVLFPAGARVLRVGCRSGQEAAALAPAGAGFDGAYVNLGALGLADLRAVGAAVAAALRPGAAVVVSLPGRWPLPATIRRTLTGVGDAPPVVATAAEVRGTLGAAFEWTDSYA